MTTPSHDTRSPAAPAQDQLRWQLSPVLSLVLDAANQVAAEVLGQRAIVPDARDLAEAARQARTAQSGSGLVDDGFLLAAEIAAMASGQQHEAIRQHIQDAATRQLGPGYARDVAADAITGIGPVLTQAVTAAAAEIVRGLAADPAWREILGVRVLDAYRDRTGHVELFLREIAQITLTAGCDSPRCGECGQDPVNAAVLDDLITRARALTSPAPAPDGSTAAAPLPAPVPGVITVPDPAPAGPAAG